jgi:predicted ATP-grasp superfamily ATP-dependent carboligase
VLAVAALSARAIVESAARDGMRCIALDLFGDADTRRTAQRWMSIGEPAAMRIDGERLLAALAQARDRGAVAWIAGSGFEGQPDLLEAGAHHLPLWGTAGADVARVRDPQTFFECLHASGIAHPPVCLAPPRAPGSWLYKNSGACGGRHVRRSADGHPGPGRHWQLERTGPSMSATFVANGEDAVVLGFNRQIVRSIGGRPFVFAGVIGPVMPSDTTQRTIGDAVRKLARAFRVRGLASLDFVLHDDRAEVIELNPRPPASLSLYPRVGAFGPLQAHRRACLHDVLPAGPGPADVVRGIEIVFAPRAMRLDAAAVESIARWPRVHDQPQAGAAFGPGDPLCSLSASGTDPAQVQAALTLARDALLQSLETLR